MKPGSFILIILIGSGPLTAQDDLSKLFNDSTAGSKQVPVIATFKSTQIINGQSNETIHKHDLVFIVQHRFGDIAGTNGGIKNFFGLDNSSDILIAFDYGISDRLSMGTGRAKGAPNGTSTSIKQLYYLNLKYRLLRQTTNDRIPFSITLFANTAASAMSKLDLAISDADFRNFSDRLSGVGQIIIARKFTDAFSLAVLPTYVRRNYVQFMDLNNLFALGFGGRFKFTPSMALVIDYFLPFRSKESKDYYLKERDFSFYHPLGIGLEIETGGHIFHLSFTNSTAVLENQFIPSTSSNWTSGAFRWGFSISRTFTLSKKTRRSI